MVKSIGDLFTTLESLEITGNPEIMVSEVTADSRMAGPETLFVAVKGTGGDGHGYIGKALAKGCQSVVHEDPLELFLTAEQISNLKVTVRVKNTRAFPALLARELTHRPDEKMMVAAVTGTNGKTTVSFLLQEMLNHLAGPCGLIGTICYDDGNESIPAPLTTPGGPVFYHWLERMAANRCGSVAMELSSHALDQHRTAGLGLAVAVMTNIGRDHLDYHQDIASYVKAKTAIFDLLKHDGTAVVNIADEYLRALDTGPRPTLYFDPRPSERKVDSADLILVEAELNLTGIRLVLDFQGSKQVLESPLVGRFNVENLMASFCAGIALGFAEKVVCKALARVQQVPGRLERFLLPNGGLAVVDYAHTHDALEAVLNACDEISQGKLLLVVGCGGDRDKGKRPLMGKVAATMSDRVWITSDNPRSENPTTICEHIAVGYQSAETGRSQTMVIIEDRKEAIDTALSEVKTGDIVIVAGKGHEDYQLVGDKILPLDDRQIIREWIEGH